MMGIKKCRIFDIWVEKTPQRGSWCAGVKVHDLKTGASASWSGGAHAYEGADARLLGPSPGADIILDNVGSGDDVKIFLAIDDDPTKAGTDLASDKVTFTFQIYPKDGGDVYWYERGAWRVGVQYSFMD